MVGIALGDDVIHLNPSAPYAPSQQALPITDVSVRLVSVAPGSLLKTRRGAKYVDESWARQLNQEALATQSMLEGFFQDPTLLDRGLRRYLYDKNITIDPLDIPHSQPFTLSTDYNSHPDRLLSVFIHEQLHVFLASQLRSANTDRAIEELKGLFPNVEVPPGLRNAPNPQYATYLHIITNWLEYQVMRRLLRDENRVRAVFLGNTVYPQLYQLILDSRNQSTLSLVMARNSLMP